MLFIFGYHSTCNVRSVKLHCTSPCMEILGRPWIFLKVALYDAKSNIPWHDCPSPVYPSLQVHLWEPSVLIQFAVTLQAWLPLRHSLISSSTNDIDIEYFMESLSGWYLSMRGWYRKSRKWAQQTSKFFYIPYGPTLHDAFGLVSSFYVHKENKFHFNDN